MITLGDLEATRLDWDEYFMCISQTVAKRSTCNRASVGCLLVLDNRILATGYVGSVRGMPHCIDVGCEIDEKTGGCVRTVHAEQNALIQAAKSGVSVEGATCYTTLSPCYVCLKLLVNTGIKRIIYMNEYRIPPRFDVTDACGVEMGCVGS